MVSNLEALKSYLQAKVKNFQAGSIRNYLENWKSITSDSEILEIVNGLPIECSNLSQQVGTMYNNAFPADQVQFLDKELKL